MKATLVLSIFTTCFGSSFLMGYNLGVVNLPSSVSISFNYSLPYRINIKWLILTTFCFRISRRSCRTTTMDQIQQRWIPTFSTVKFLQYLWHVLQLLRSHVDGLPITLDGESLNCEEGSVLFCQMGNGRRKPIMCIFVC